MSMYARIFIGRLLPILVAFFTVGGSASLIASARTNTGVDSEPALPAGYVLNRGTRPNMGDRMAPTGYLIRHDCNVSNIADFCLAKAVGENHTHLRPLICNYVDQNHHFNMFSVLSTTCEADDFIANLINTPSPPPGVTLGINTTLDAHRLSINVDSNLTDGNNNRSLLPQIAMAGIKWVRADARWSSIERSAGNYDFSSLGAWIDSTSKAGLEIHWTVDYNNPIIPYSKEDSCGNPTLSNPPAIDGFVNYATELARYILANAGAGAVYEIWDEPLGEALGCGPSDGRNGPGTLSFADYANLVKLTIRAIKNIDPSAKVIISALEGYIDADELTAFFAEFKGAYPAWDGVGIHTYLYAKSSGCAPNGDPETIFSISAECTDTWTMFETAKHAAGVNAVTWNTEGGAPNEDHYGPLYNPDCPPTAKNCDADNQARSEVRRILTHWAAGFAEINLYAAWTNLETEEYNIFRSDFGSQTKTVTAIETLTHALGGTHKLTGFSFDSNADSVENSSYAAGVMPTLNVFRTENSSEIVYALWVRYGTYTLRNVPDGLIYRTMYGQEGTTIGGTLQLTGLGGPIYLTIRKLCP